MELLRGMSGVNESQLGDFQQHIAEHGANQGILTPKLSLASDGVFETFYAPFDHITIGARVTIVGLTPGQAQMRIAIEETYRALRDGLSWPQAIECAKYAASFGGPMRINLTRMLDHIGLNRWLRIESCGLLFSDHRSLAHHTSVLRYPVFKNGKNYSGQPPIRQLPFLRSQVDRWFVEELSQLPNSIFVPLGGQAQNVIEQLVQEKVISSSRALLGLPHPSGANAERIAYFLAKKRKEELSPQTNADLIDRIRERLLEKVHALN